MRCSNYCEIKPVWTKLEMSSNTLSSNTPHRGLERKDARFEQRLNVFKQLDEFEPVSELNQVWTEIELRTSRSGGEKNAHEIEISSRRGLNRKHNRNQKECVWRGLRSSICNWPVYGSWASAEWALSCRFKAVRCYADLVSSNINIHFLPLMSSSQACAFVLFLALSCEGRCRYRFVLGDFFSFLSMIRYIISVST
jgi:hypothetical protein